jgi:hypothetical protein
MRAGIVFSPFGNLFSSSVASQAHACKHADIPPHETALLHPVNYD